MKQELNLVFASVDIILGPVAVTLEQYIKYGLLRLQDEGTYEIISQEKALLRYAELRTPIKQWTWKHVRALSTSSNTYTRTKLVETEEDPFGYCYLPYKLHKTPIKTRPVYWDCLSTAHVLGQWVDKMLQPMVQAQAIYLKDSFALKKLLDALILLGDYSLIFCDAVSMYTNNGTDQCVAQLSAHLLDPVTSK